MNFTLLYAIYINFPLFLGILGVHLWGKHEDESVGQVCETGVCVWRKQINEIAFSARYNCTQKDGLDGSIVLMRIDFWHHVLTSLLCSLMAKERWVDHGMLYEAERKEIRKWKITLFDRYHWRGEVSFKRTGPDHGCSAWEFWRALLQNYEHCR